MPVALVVAVGFAVLFVSGGARFAVGLTFKPMVDELGWARGELGLAVGLYPWCRPSPPSSREGSPTGWTRARCSAAASSSAASAPGLMSLVSAPWHAMLLYGVVFAIGNGAASLTTVGVMVTRSAPERAGLANAAVISGTSAGQLVMIAVHWPRCWSRSGGARCSPVSPQRISCCCCSRPPPGAAAGCRERAAPGSWTTAAARTPRFWLLLAMYAICGLDDFFVATHVVPSPRTAASRCSRATCSR